MPTEGMPDFVTAELNAGDAKLNGGTLKIYTGSEPAVDTSTPTGTLLVTLTLSATAFANATESGGTVTATANSITSANAVATGTAGYAVLENSSGAPEIYLSVGTSGSGADLILSSTSITSGQQVAITSFTTSQSETGS